jgi:molybdate transport system regulatory protein
MSVFFLNTSDQAIQVITKVWLEIDGQMLFGEGRAQLLRHIQETNSINASAKIMGLSFRRAWAMVKDMEAALNMILVEKKRGGIGGGTAILTPAAIELLERYEKILKEFNTFSLS